MPSDYIDDLRLRAAKASDAGTLTEVAQESKALWGYPSSWLERWRPQLTITHADIGRMIVRVAESRGEVVAFGALDYVRDEWEIAHLWVRPTFTRRGIGRILLTELADAGRTAGARRLRIESDPQAESFYLRAGAVRTGAVPAPMPEAPERALPLLELSLDG